MQIFLGFWSRFFPTVLNTTWELVQNFSENSNTIILLFYNGDSDFPTDESLTFKMAQILPHNPWVKISVANR